MMFASSLSRPFWDSPPCVHSAPRRVNVQSLFVQLLTVLGIFCTSYLGAQTTGDLSETSTTASLPKFEDIQNAQRFLNEIGLNVGQPDGSLNTPTQVGLAAFARHSRLDLATSDLVRLLADFARKREQGNSVRRSSPGRSPTQPAHASTNKEGLKATLQLDPFSIDQLRQTLGKHFSLVERWCTSGRNAADLNGFLSCMTEETASISGELSSPWVSGNNPQLKSLQDQRCPTWQAVRPNKHFQCLKNTAQSAAARLATNSKSPQIAAASAPGLLTSKSIRGDDLLESSSHNQSEKRQIGFVCSRSRPRDEPELECVRSELKKLASTFEPKLNFLESFDRDLIRRACAAIRYARGPADFYQCLNRQLSILSSVGRKPSRSTIATSTRARCAHHETRGAIARYYSCVKE